MTATPRLTADDSATARLVLASLTSVEREALARYYLDGQHPDEICRALHMSLAQFRDLKRQARQRYKELQHD